MVSLNLVIMVLFINREREIDREIEILPNVKIFSEGYVKVSSE